MKTNGCIDAGREGCPCALAEHGKCLACSRLSGGTCNDCSWQGSCIYTLYVQNSRKLIRGRESRILPIEEVKTYQEQFKVFILRADKGFCQKAQTAGAYVFVKGTEQDDWHDMPVSVLKAEPEKGLLHLGVCDCGVKSGSLFEAEEFLSVRGIYYNALSGLGKLLENPEEAVVFAKGIAIAPLRNFLDSRRYEKWIANLKLFMDLDKVGMDFFRDYFGDLPICDMQVRSFAGEGLCDLDELDRLEAAEYTNVFALTSPYYAEQVGRAAAQDVVRPMEGNMCCGEGVCGACTCVDESGQTIHRCKARM
ncbi:MAG: hypothetical protein ACLRWH_00020 [Emergencia sp.]